jgi:hypothetical protein
MIGTIKLANFQRVVNQCSTSNYGIRSGSVGPILEKRSSLVLRPVISFWRGVAMTVV